MEDNTFTAERIRQLLIPKKLKLEEKKMFGGWCFMVDDKMLMGTYKGGIMARVNPDKVTELLEKEGAEQMVHGGRALKGYLMIDPIAYDLDTDLEFWVQQCLDWNPFVKVSKKKKKVKK